MKFPKEAAVFEYVPVDEDDCGGMAIDYVLTAGDIIEGWGRCCVNCTLINGCIGSSPRDRERDHVGGFTPAELRPLTQAARDMLALVT